ncbi:glycine betaine ABC transporter substrate-binding protein [Arsenophonus endosymbiont of Bemisia tabaci Asia II 3]|nr:glycine betaine ABC transporter substrate-binding protein [Arsenophonus endosymbiont of Bemisia tabaci Asia II 3]
MRKTILLAAALTTLISIKLSATELPSKCIKVQPMQSTIAEETFQTLIVNKALEKLGYQILPIQEVDYTVAYASIAVGDATFMAVNWQPLHNAQYAAVGGDNRIYRKGIYVSNAVQGYPIDKKTADKYRITSIAQFKDANIAKLFDTNGNGKADLTGCNSGWGCEATINNHLNAYQLNTTVEHNQGNYAAMIADTITRYKEGKPIFYYTWASYWVNAVLKPGKDVVWLQVPFSSLSNDDKSDTTLANGKNYGFPPSTMHIVANKIWAAKNPAAAKLFAIMEIPITDINAHNLRMQDGEASQADIERHAQGWIKAHQQLFNNWIKIALKTH